MQTMKKVEVIVESVYLNRLLKMFKDNGVENYTLIQDVEGRGGHGLKPADDVSEVCSNDYFFTLVEEEQFVAIKEHIRTFIKKYGGKCILSDVMVILS
jgi:nitrogen regulatory protein PII